MNTEKVGFYRTKPQCEISGEKLIEELGLGGPTDYATAILAVFERVKQLEAEVKNLKYPLD